MLSLGLNHADSSILRRTSGIRPAWRVSLILVKTGSREILRPALRESALFLDGKRLVCQSLKGLVDEASVNAEGDDAIVPRYLDAKQAEQDLLKAHQTAMAIRRAPIKRPTDSPDREKVPRAPGVAAGKVRRNKRSWH